ncbi:hypothetical protein [Bacillus sp. 7894-2]|uniref:hypothetical protein n=1 Tax=Bacillus sp. 7894-2 TaxID=2021695 RepID=UPI000BA630DF|nr:hypothetical protein [Bacillus sp. 7894-2]PAE24022.1 hypothetical protein CHI10_14550 [Bacillus sp. 7894-2]
MNKTKLNELVLAYQNGSELALADLFNAVNPLIERASKEVEPFVDDFTKFDCRVVREIQRQIDSFEYGKHDFLAAVKTIISQSKARFIRRNSRKKDNYVSMVALEGNGDEDLGYQFEADGRTEDYVMFKERVTLLAQGNPKKETILLQWSRGAEDKSISELLAQLYGGKAESHRKFIQRFKTDCKELLSI